MYYATKPHPTRLQTRRTGPAAYAARVMNKHRGLATRGGPSLTLRLSVWSAWTAVAGVFVGTAVTSALGPDMLATLTGVATFAGFAAAPAGVWRLGRLLTTEVPAFFSDPVKVAVTKIDELAEVDPTKADRLFSELLSYLPAAKIAVELDRGRRETLTRQLTDLHSRLWFLVDAEHERRNKQIQRLDAELKELPLTKVLHAIEGVGQSATEVLAFERDALQFAEAPRRELEAQIAAEREVERTWELTEAFASVMAQAETLTEMHSTEIRAEARIGRDVIRRQHA